ncbi:hypothetical protein RJI07_06100 [Mycoplasmatota bacterium WC30]
MKKLFHVLFEAVDNESTFFQNIYPYAESKFEAIEVFKDYLNQCGYIRIKVEEVSEIDSIVDIDDIIQNNKFNGYIQNTKYRYPDYSDDFLA